VPQTGVGIEFREGNLHAFCGRSLWSRFRVVDRLEIAQYREMEPRECGRLYRQFLKRNGLKAPWTVVALPRSMVLLRALQFPKAMENEMGRAVELQLDSLHPFEEGGVYWDFAKARDEQQPRWSWKQDAASGEAQKPVDVLVAIAERESVDQLAEWFQEAGIPVSQFGVTTALLLGMFRSRGTQAATTDAPFFVLHTREDGCELIGTAPGKPVLSKEILFGSAGLATEEDRRAAVVNQLELARSELRLAPEERPVVLAGGSGLQLETSPGFDGASFRVVPVEEAMRGVMGMARVGVETLPLRENVVGVAATLGAVERRGLFGLNLLPAMRRSYEPPAVLVPTYALASLVVLMAVALGLRGPVQDWLYSRHLERERQALLPQIQQLERIQDQNRRVFERLTTLASLGRSANLPMELLDELTRLLPEDAWLQQLQFDGSAVNLGGTAASASAVLQALTESNRLESPQFLSAITRTQDGKEGFRIGARLRAANP
jgi:Tfp pilus assembly protein PilN